MHLYELYHCAQGNQVLLMNSEASLIWGILFGSFGLAYFIYGKKQKKILPLLCGLGLMLFPYFVTNVTLIVIIGILLVIMPWFIKY